MKIRNTRKKSNYINYKVGGISTKTNVPAGEIADVPAIKDLNQVINLKDFNIGFFEVVESSNIDVVLEKKSQSKENEILDEKSKKESGENKGVEEDSLEKAKKEVEDYTDNSDEGGKKDNK